MEYKILQIWRCVFINIDQEFFAASLSSLMEQRGVTKYQLAKALNFSQSSIANWLNKTAAPSRRSIEALAKYFGVSIPALTGRSSGLVATANEPYYPEEEIKKAPPAEAEDAELAALLEDLRNRPDMRMLFHLAHGATPDDVRQAVKIIEALRKE